MRCQRNGGNKMHKKLETILTAEICNNFTDEELPIADMEKIYKKTCSYDRPLHFECNDGKWTCVEGE